MNNISNDNNNNNNNIHNHIILSMNNISNDKNNNNNTNDDDGYDDDDNDDDYSPSCSDCQRPELVCVFISLLLAPRFECRDVVTLGLKALLQ